VTAASIWNDSPVSYNRGNGALWKPMNYERKLYGELSLRQALAHSNNVITVKLLDSIGVTSFTDFAGKLGLPLRGRDLSLALGTEEVTLNELVAAYTPLANGGLRAEPRTIIRIYERKKGAWNETAPALTPVISPATAYVATQMLKDVMVYGTAKGLKKFSQQHPSAGKTGTTDDYRDAWFVGYTPQLITGVWVGYDKPRPGGKGFTGGVVSAPIWENFMRQAVAGKPAVDFAKPESVVSATIDPGTGYLAAPDCPSTREEYFVLGTEPTQYCPAHGGDALPPVTPALPAVPAAPDGEMPDAGQEPAGEIGPAPPQEEGSDTGGAAAPSPM
jgi:membrane carboxypeptidase/penicillin-binding protein